MRTRIIALVSALLLMAFMAGCSSTSNANNTNANANVNSNTTTTTTTNTTSSVTTSSPATSAEYETTTAEENGSRVETRTYRNNERISKVVITTKGNQRTMKVYPAGGGEAREVNKSDVESLMDASADRIADAAGFVKSKTTTAAQATANTAQTVGHATANTARTVGETTANVASTVGHKTANGAKKVGGAVKRAVSP